MKINERDQKVRIAEANLILKLIEYQDEHDLTNAEMLHMLAQSIEKLAWRMIRIEGGRLGDSE